MKTKISCAALGLALALGACGEGADTDATTAAAGNQQLQLEPIPAPEGGDWTEVVERTGEGGFRMGNPDAPVKLVEFASMTCPACAAFAKQGSEQLKNDYVRTGHVSFEFRNFVLNGPDAAASLLARCQPPGAFFRLTDQLFAEQQTWLGNMTDEQAARLQQVPPEQQVPALARALELDQFFRRRGMPESEVNACLNNRQELERLAELNQRAIDQHGISGTQSFLINGELVEGVSDWSWLEPRIRAALAQRR
jgi:protein-disulfide isomerase